MDKAGPTESDQSIIPLIKSDTSEEEKSFKDNKSQKTLSNNYYTATKQPPKTDNSILEAMTIDQRWKMASRSPSPNNIKSSSTKEYTTNDIELFDICIPVSNENGDGINYTVLEGQFSFLEKNLPVTEAKELLKQKSHKLDVYEDEEKFTLYSFNTGLFQAHSFENLGEGFLPGLLKEGGFWIDVCDPSVEEMTFLAKVIYFLSFHNQLFNLHPLTTEDIICNESREKCEVFENYIFTCVKSFEQRAYDPMQLFPLDIFIVMFDTHVITIHRNIIPHVKNVMKRMDKLFLYLKISADWVVYAMLDDIVDAFMPYMQSIELEVESIDDLVLVLTEHDQHDMLRRIGVARKRVTTLQRFLKIKTDIIKVLTKRVPDRLNSHTLLYLRDINDHVISNIQNLEHFNETLNRSHGNYLAQISIEITQASNRMNVVMKKMTAWGSVLLPLSLVAGIWGMNVHVPGQPGASDESLIPFFLVLIGMFTIAVIIFMALKTRRWF
ncbi:cora-domain-containing protein [Rozella allomycis CSF55]|uniref:Cora-domain-containing protein n=1 Tax=Rozella allomycis (strain CSF55) TaxID=988480 RepID=A0A075AYI6_ROZAC|nr:Mg2+, CorA-like/Zinc transporter domain-containing protein [Rozella allomycis CSF55]RKP21783.1 cora-domain-containing protein [Rozella allomycis CSF55]|eukprot:EPZ35390.1 Mg2+, CorA-like/Zinc transporter domain-containing protein [Rozella allomycis CSF55]